LFKVDICAHYVAWCLASVFGHILLLLLFIRLKEKNLLMLLRCKWSSGCPLHDVVLVISLWQVICKQYQAGC